MLSAISWLHCFVFLPDTTNITCCHLGINMSCRCERQVGKNCAIIYMWPVTTCCFWGQPTESCYQHRQQDPRSSGFFHSRGWLVGWLVGSDLGQSISPVFKGPVIKEEFFFDILTQQTSAFIIYRSDTKSELDGKTSDTWQELGNPETILRMIDTSGYSDN